MKIPATSHPEKQEKVYEFWLGFFEKITVLLFAVVIIPRVVGQLNYNPSWLFLWASVIFGVLSVMIWLTRKLWYLPKEKNNEEKKTSLLMNLPLRACYSWRFLPAFI